MVCDMGIVSKYTKIETILILPIVKEYEDVDVGWILPGHLHPFYLSSLVQIMSLRKE